MQKHKSKKEPPLKDQNLALIRRLFDLFRQGEREQAAALFSEDGVFCYPGSGPLHGNWNGSEGVISFWAEQDSCSGGRFLPEMLDIVAGDHRVFLLVRIVQNESFSWSRVVVYEILSGEIKNARVYEDDPSAAETFFSTGERK